MNNFDINSLLSSFGFFYITQGQVIMLFVGLILLYLAINKKFEPLLLVPIGFGTILSNIPEIGLAYSGLEKIIFENDPETLSNLAMLLGLDFINADVVKNLDLVSLSNAEKYAAELGYTSGILYKFYSVSIGSGIAPLLIFMGIPPATAVGTESVQILGSSVSGAMAHGLKKNIEDGIDHVFKFEEKIICLEDDLVLDKYFLSYMNLCLEKYNNKNEIWHINGWSHPQQRLFLSEIFVGKIVNVWGWATWKNRWIKHSIRSEDNISKLDKNSIKRFNFYNLNRNFQQQLIDNDINKINTWAIYWYQTVFLNHGKTIYPKHSLVKNTGLDGSGTNSGKTKYFDPSLKNVNLSKFSKSLEVDKVNNTFTILFYLKIYISKKYTYYKNKLNKKFNP